MSFDTNQMPGSDEKKSTEAEEAAGRVKRFKIWFAAVFLLCFVVIAGSAVFYYQLNN
jgi:hypothetical protein